MELAWGMFWCLALACACLLTGMHTFLSTARCMFFCSSTCSVLASCADCLRQGSGAESHPDEVSPAWTLLVAQLVGTDSSGYWLLSEMQCADVLSLSHPSQRVPFMCSQTPPIDQFMADQRLAWFSCDDNGCGHDAVLETDMKLHCPL